MCTLGGSKDCRRDNQRIVEGPVGEPKYGETQVSKDEIA